MVVELNALARTADEKVATFPWRRGAARGVAAFFLGWAAVAGLSFATPGENTGPLADQLQLLGLLFYNFQFVPLRTANHLAPWLPGDPLNPVAGLQTQVVPKLTYYLLPVVALLALGAELGYRTADDDGRAVHSVFCGLSLALGYAGAALAFALVLSFPTNLGGTARPDLLWTLGMGLEYPLVFGSVGAYVGQRLGQA